MAVRDFSFRAGNDPEGKHPFVAAYSAGIQIVVFPFGQWTFSVDEARLRDDTAGLSFDVEVRTGGVALVANLPGYCDRITIELDADGALERYRHDVGSHRMVISLDEPLPLTGSAAEATSRFSILMDPDEPVASGRVVSEPTKAGRRLSVDNRHPVVGSRLSVPIGHRATKRRDDVDGQVSETVRLTLALVGGLWPPVGCGMVERTRRLCPQTSTR